MQRLHAAAALALLLAACSAAAEPDALPLHLSGTGLWSDASTHALAPDVLAFAPQYPLWTDGATKRRWIRLPPGSAIDARDPDAWAFPVGTRLWKEFSVGRRVETRYMERAADGWRFATYVWDERGADAVLAPEAGLRAVCTTEGGAPYDVPGRADCRACHAAGPNAVLGFSALQLSPDRDPLAPHAEAPAPDAVDLAELVERGLVRGLPAELVETPPRIAATDPVERAALGYLHGNCGGCHDARGELAGLGLDLWSSLAGGPDDGARATTLGRASRFRFRTGGEPLRVAPGEPDASVLLGRMRSRQPLAQMPPLGTHVPDARALELVADWIRGTAAEPRRRPEPGSELRLSTR